MEKDIMGHKKFGKQVKGEGKIPLEYAAAWGDIEIVKILLNGARKGKSDLEYAARHGNCDADRIKMLLRLGADPEKNKDAKNE